MEKRVYSKKISIDTEKTRELYNQRGKRLGDMKSVYTSVLLGDQNPEYADKWDETEKGIISPYLGLNSNSKVLDLGCGIGRWAEHLMPECKSYTGVDFSEEMVRNANERCSKYLNDDKKFVCSSVQDYLKLPYTAADTDIVIVSYVCMYINDSDIIDCFQKILDRASEKCVLYFIDTVALEERLTLNEIYSEALKSDYSALYRTIKEYDDFFSVFYNAGFKKADAGFMPKLNNEAEYSETDRHYTILVRG